MFVFDAKEIKNEVIYIQCDKKHQFYGPKERKRERARVNDDDDAAAMVAFFFPFLTTRRQKRVHLRTKQESIERERIEREH